MDNYEKEMFEFLTLEENLKGLIIAKNQFNSVRDTLIKTLWEKVEANLKNQFDGKVGWFIERDKQISDMFSKIYLYDKEIRMQRNALPSFFFGWERLSQKYPYYGFWINTESDEYRVEEIASYLKGRKHEIARGLGGPDGCWLFWGQDKQLEFNNDNTLINIIPTKVDNKAKELSDMLLDLFNDMQESYNFIKKEFKK